MDLEEVDFDDAGAGVCLIWSMRFEGELELDDNLADIEGLYGLSNSITVTRN